MGKDHVNKMYEHFGEMVRAKDDLGELQGVYCLSAREDFKRRSGLDWRTELRFLNSGIWVDLLRWTGKRTNVVRKASRPQRKERNSNLEAGVANVDDTMNTKADD